MRCIAADGKTASGFPILDADGNSHFFGLNADVARTRNRQSARARGKTVEDR
jgi:hypothetical protein